MKLKVEVFQFLTPGVKRAKVMNYKTMRGLTNYITRQSKSEVPVCVRFDTNGLGAYEIYFIPQSWVDQVRQAGLGYLDVLGKQVREWNEGKIFFGVDSFKRIHTNGYRGENPVAISPASYWIVYDGRYGSSVNRFEDGLASINKEVGYVEEALK